MVNFLRKIFIKDYQNVNDACIREKHGFLAAFGGIFVNLLLFAFKLTVGILSFSISIISDAVNNLTDLFSCFVTLIGFKIASKPADKRHPYGHERVEYITGMIIALIIICVSFILGGTSITKLINGQEITKFDLFTFIVLGVSILFKIFLAFFYKGIGKAISSESLKASMQDSFNDAICTTGVLIAALVSYFVGNISWLDPAISLCISVFILYSGIKAILETASPLIGVPLDKNLVKSISHDISSYPGILGLHDLTCHTYGHTKIFVTVHVEVDGYANMLETHDIIDRIESDIDAKYGIELTIHIDPIDTKNKELPILKKQLNEIVKNIEPLLTIHDVRMLNSDGIIHISFDVLKNENCSFADEELEKIIKEKVNSLNPTYILNIKIDHSFD